MCDTAPRGGRGGGRCHVDIAYFFLMPLGIIKYMSTSVWG